MNSVGDILRQERERQGLDIDRVAQQTRISPRFIEAIESNNIAQLPGGFFYRSFVRQYAQTLGIDESLVESDLDKQAEEQMTAEAERARNAPPHFEVPPMPSTYRPAGERQFPLILILLVTVVVGCSAIYLLWQRSQEPTVVETRLPEGSPPQPQQQAAPVPAPVSQEPAAATTPTTTAATPPEGAAQPQAGAAQQTAAPAPAANPPGAATPGVPTIEVMATEEVWLSISADGEKKVERVLKPGEIRRVEGKEKVTMLTGNAGGLVVTANGKLVTNVGPKGQVRTVNVTAAGAEVVAPAPRKPADPEQ
ncbi:MAG: DUF4115 domain-containing protein [Bryobacteraceae bacterium]|nr:DUF4115 domain-containing protein [Bryobacteraceae bacterium]